jgi:hypothetical protein
VVAGTQLDLAALYVDSQAFPRDALAINEHALISKQKLQVNGLELIHTEAQLSYRSFWSRS